MVCTPRDVSDEDIAGASGQLEHQPAVAEPAWEDPSPDGTLGHLFEAVETGNTSAVQGLLPRLPAQLLSAIGPEGDTLLHVACVYGHAQCATVLLDAGASVTTRDEDGSTVLHDACASGIAHVVQRLVSSDPALVHATDLDGDTPLHNAARGGHAEIVRSLLATGVPPLVVNNAGHTAKGTCGVDIDQGVRALLEAAESAAADSNNDPS